MSVFSKTSHYGELMVDHRASPGLTESQALRLGHGLAAGEGKVLHAPTLGCPHCGAVVVLNPGRTRERAYCDKCDKHICDGCDAVRHEPDYQHLTILEIAEKMQTGRYDLIGNSMSRLRLIPKETYDG